MSEAAHQLTAGPAAGGKCTPHTNLTGVAAAAGAAAATAAAVHLCLCRGTKQTGPSNGPFGSFTTAKKAPVTAVPVRL